MNKVSAHLHNYFPSLVHQSTGLWGSLQLGKLINVAWMPPLLTRKTMHLCSRQLGFQVHASTDKLAKQPESPGLWEPPQIERLYEDNLIIAIAKPATLLVHNNKSATWLEKQRNAFAKNMVEAQLTSGQEVSPVHRLDRASSGVMLFSKTSDATRAAQASLNHPSSMKEYVVLARGSTPNFFVCDEPVNDEKGVPRSALSECKKILDLPKARCSLLKVVIKTGRWHQIRKHLNHRAHHVIGDVKHGKGETNRFFRENYKMQSGRMFLHAAALTFPHPFHLPQSNWNLGSTSQNVGVNEGISSPSAPKNVGVDFSPSSIANSICAPEDCSIWMAPGTTAIESLNCKYQLLTIRAVLPDDLQQVLYSIPENLTQQNLLSLGLLF